MSDLGTIIASATGSSMATILLNPMLIIKVHMQKVSTVPRNARPVQGTMAIYKHIMKKRGLLGFWAGTRMGLLQAVPSSVAYMTVYEKGKRFMFNAASSDSRWRPMIPGMAGAIARFISVSLISPIELIRTIQASGVNQTGMSIAKNLHEYRGVGGFYLGWQNTIMRDVPYSCMYWGAYEAFKKKFLQGPVENNNVSIFLSGSCAGVISAFLTHPFDVIKTKQQVNVAALAKVMEQNRNAGTSSSIVVEEACYTIKDLFHKGGIRALFRGVSVRCAMVVPGSSIFLTVYENVKAVSI